MTTRLMLVRHGQTASNVRMVLDSAPPGPPLTRQGRQQALELADSLATEPVVGVYASRAVRAQETAAPVASRHGLTVQVLDGVQEVDVGELEGRNDHAAIRCFLDVFAEWADGNLDLPMPGGGESATQVLKRYLDAMREIRRGHTEGIMVLVSHGAAIRLAASTLAENITSALGAQSTLPNTGRVMLEADGDNWQCLEWTGVALH